MTTMGFRRTKLNWPSKEEVADCREAGEQTLHPRTHVSFRVRLSRDFSRIHQKESLVAGKLSCFVDQESE